MEQIFVSKQHFPILLLLLFCETGIELGLSEVVLIDEDPFAFAIRRQHLVPDYLRVSMKALLSIRLPESTLKKSGTLFILSKT